MDKLPSWFRQDIPDDKVLGLTHLFLEFGVHTVCREAKCPNMNYCFRNNRATFMILGNTCTRNCGFCNVNKSEGSPLRLTQEPSMQEGHRISQLVKMLGMKYVVITSVSRDDLADGGAGQFSITIELIKKENPGVQIEVLIPDFKGSSSSLRCLTDACPDVVGHNIETVKRLYRDIRPKADYELSLRVLKKIKELSPRIRSKSSIMLGLGEMREEVLNTMRDLRDADCDTLTLGQYLAPSVNHYPVKEFVGIDKFREYQDKAKDMGFKSVLSGPLVRSSYQAQELYREMSPCTI
jgi:lipoic acid synthetase